MSGHSKWSTIKHRKGAQDAKKGKVYGKHARLIEIAAKGGSDPLNNAALAMAIENAKGENVPNDNIQRAIKKGSGEGKDATIYEEVMYEGYLPGGVSVIIETLTDNKNRAYTNVKTIVNKNGGNMGESGSVSWSFKHKGQLVLDLTGKDQEEFEMNVLESGAEDYDIVDDSEVYVTTDSKELGQVRDFFKNSGYEVKSASLAWIPDNRIEIEDKAKAASLIKIITLLEEDDDVSDVYANFDISDNIINDIEI